MRAYWCTQSQHICFSDAYNRHERLRWQACNMGYTCNTTIKSIKACIASGIDTVLVDEIIIQRDIIYHIYDTYVHI